MKLFNTLTRTTEDIKHTENNKISMYTCGLTVYSQPHIGNWVAYIYWDVLVRALKTNGYDVTRVQNITDVGHLTSDEDAGEDKMLAGALKEGLTAWEVAEKYIQIADHEAYDLLGLLRPDHMPRATDYIPQQIAFIEELEQKGYSYQIADGIYFDTSKLTDYGKLAQLDINGLVFGARVQDTGKKNPTDFALWKFSPEGQKRDMEWESPWGKGFPGWHLECSVMARELLGDQIDIHTGGIDHIPVHHTNEIAQTEAVTGKAFSITWVHANHIKVDGTKMSKSLGNIYTLQDVLDRGFDLAAFKLLVLNKHYTKEGNFTWDNLEAAQNRLNHWKTAAALVWQQDILQKSPPQYTDGDVQIGVKQFLIALEYDLDTPGALATIDAVIHNIERHYSLNDTTSLTELFTVLNTLLGIDIQTDDITSSQKQLISDRQTARDTKNWDASDQLREQLHEQSIEVKDTPYGQIWSRT